MRGIYFLLPTLLTIFISFLVVRAGAIALMLTGIDRDRAVFQALSAFTGTGFTTKEAERVVGHPLRRKVISWLMILGNAGIVTVIITASTSMITSKVYRLPINALILIAGIYLIYKLALSRWFVRRWESFIEKRFVKASAFEESPVEDLLHLVEGYGLVRGIIKEDSPWIGSTLLEFRTGEKEFLFLGIERGKEWVPFPKVYEKIQEGDRLVVYGHLNALREHFKEE